MKLTDFIKEKVIYLTLDMFAIVFAFAVLNVHNIAPYSIFYIILIMIIAFYVPLIAEFISKRKFYNNLRDISDKLAEKFLLSEMIDAPDFYEGELFCEILKECSKSMNDEIAKYKISTTDYRDYIEKWVHDIKTPISACKLAVENSPDKFSYDLIEDIDKIDSYVMQTLFYSRISNVEKDYIIKEITLNDITASALKANSRMLIKNGFSITRTNLESTVMTDEKWIGFVLDQIISNSVKYKSKNPTLTFNGKENENSITLIIADNGIGIEPRDISRIFEKNFTGGNGRLNKKSTGFGLYLCKKLCIRLGINISAVSQNGTAIMLEFPKSQAGIMK